MPPARRDAPRASPESIDLGAAPLSRSFYAEGALTLAPKVLGKVLVRRLGDTLLAGRIVEVEAYCGLEDRAAHTYGGRRTPRNEVMWGREGHLYVYFVYGMHWCMNLTAARAEVPEALLVRGLEPLAGLAELRANRGRPVPDSALLRGPANACKALGVNGHHNGVDLCGGDAAWLIDAPAVPAAKIHRTPRIGVDYAGADAARPWRYSVVGSSGVSGPAALRA